MGNHFCNEPSQHGSPELLPRSLNNAFQVPSMKCARHGKLCRPSALISSRCFMLLLKLNPRNGSPSATALLAWEQACPAGLASDRTRMQCKCQIGVSLLFANCENWPHYIMSQHNFICLLSESELVFNKITMLSPSFIQSEISHDDHGASKIQNCKQQAEQPSEKS